MKFSTVIYYNAVVSGDKFAAQTTIEAEDAEEYEKSMSDLFTTLALKKDETGEDLFVTFEPRAIANVPSPRGGGNSGGPLPDAPVEEFGTCPIHKVALKEKTNRRTGQKFVSCSEKTADGYCNWSPTRS